MMKVAVTGGIGSGKSYVCGLLKERGINVYDCDSAAKRIIASSAKVQSALRRVVGDDVFIEGRLNKKLLAAYLLQSDSNADIINGIVHPEVADDFRASGFDWMECAILFSSGFNRLVDKVVCVTAPLDVRLDRIVSRDGITREKALEWINKQMPQEEVAGLSDFEIVNDGIANPEIQIDKVLASLGYGR